MTEKLYYRDSHLFDFTCTVLAVKKFGKETAVILDRTAFFPEGGGQMYDTGTIGEAAVTAVRERDGQILHYLAGTLEEGRSYEGHVDREQRLCRMQNHSGEHIVSGITHNLFGYENVGFHMGETFMTLDFSGELTDDDVDRIECLANEAVRANLTVRAWFPKEEELASLEYRSKLELTRDVRLVEIPGVDVCACCAPHVSHTGEIGLIKLLTWERHRGGMRVTVTCGMDALRNMKLLQRNITEISGLLSAKRQETAAAVRRVLAEKEQLRIRCDELGDELAARMAEEYTGDKENICIFDRVLNEASLRKLINLLTVKTTGIAAAFSGSEENGYKYIIASRTINLRTLAKEINGAIDGRGGGSSEMITGFSRAGRETIETYIRSL